jgi:hypothetical protein
VNNGNGTVTITSPNTAGANSFFLPHRAELVFLNWNQ